MSIRNLVLSEPLLTLHSALRAVAWITAGLYLVMWFAAAWFVDDGGIIRQNASCMRVESNPLFWNCHGFVLSTFANAVSIAFAFTFLAPMAVAAALSKPEFWTIALPVMLLNLMGIAAVVYAILRLVSWALMGAIEYISGH